MEDLLAVDIVILLSPADQKKVLKAIDYIDDSPIRLDKADNLTHISLAMGVIHKKHLEQSVLRLANIANQFKTITGVIVSASEMTIDGLEPIYALDIKSNSSLQELHEKVTLEFQNEFLDVAASSEMFYPKSKPNQLTENWVSNFSKGSAGKNFNPHITLGSGVIDLKALPIDINLSNIAICHLGNFCVCKSALKSFELKDIL